MNKDWPDPSDLPRKLHRVSLLLGLSLLLTQHPTMKTLFISGYDDETIQHQRINQRFVLQQPYRQSGLIEKVRETLDVA